MNPYDLPSPQRIRAFDGALADVQLPGSYDALGNPRPVTLTGLAAKATAPEFEDWQRENPAMTAYHRRRDAYDPRDSWQYMAGAGIANRMGDPNNRWRRTMRRGPLAGGTAVALSAGALSLGTLWLLNRLGVIPSSMVKPVTLGAAALGAAIGGFSGSRHRNEKQASMAPRDDILAMLRQDTRTSFGEKARLQRGVMSLSQQELSRLRTMIGTAGGASVGAIIARFLLGAGRGGMLVGALVGGSVGRAIFRSNEFNKNVAGQRTRPGKNVFGSPFRR